MNETQPPKHIVELAVEVAGWSPCRSRRGVVIFSGEDVISHGHNFKPRGFECDGSEACKATCRVEAIHAEQQAIINAGRLKTDRAELLHVKAVDGALVPSGGPSCAECSKHIVAAGIARVWLYHADGWKAYDAADFHRLSLSSPVPSSERGALRTLEEDTAFTQSFDAREWAKAFNRTLVQLGYQPHDEGWLIGWFANAIMRGYDEYPKRHPSGADELAQALASQGDAQE
jgi:deoxycytidylate deaminase